jgi:poly-gamma-glutamate synthesis protein (capsule biosynthesis protein)
MKKKLVWYLLGGILLGLLAVVLAATVAIRVSVVPASAAEDTAPPSPTATPEAKPTPTAEPEPEYYTISFIGDCTLASSQYNNDFENRLGDDYSRPFRNTVKYFADDDLTVANLECSFSDQYLTSSATFYFDAPTKYTQILLDGKVDFVTTANNHRPDFGETGIKDTEAALDAAKIAHAGENETYIYDMNGVKVGLYCLSNSLSPTAELVTKGVKSLKDQGAEYIICALHWGIEGSYQVTASETAVAHAAIDAGADVIYGSHPHVLQKIEKYNDGVILYSMGNWSFGGNTAPRDRDTAIVQVKVRKAADGTISTDGYDIIPCCLSSIPSVNDYCPTPYEKDSDEYKRVLTKLDGTWKGKDLNVDYSAFH